ncbi:MAG: hypothetical protein ABS96_10010 [Lysobacteraceae bacterium SCN 69-123]|nr:MAG: hypothetical protein ABS96_10010 [Xanthomonadaceae bacterium SCN 69-123]
MVPRFAKHYFSEPSFRSLLCSEVSGVGGSLTRAQPSRVAAYPVPVAPRAEQTRIADQLDTLLARIQACQDRLEAIPALLKRFRSAVLDAAASGALIDENGPPADVVKLGSVLAEPMRNGKSVRDGSGLKVLRLTALKQSGIDLTATKTGDWTGVRDVQRFVIRDGDYLVSRGNGSKELVGRGGKVANCSDDVAFPDTMIRIRPDTSRLLPDYLDVVWAAPVVRKQIEAAAKTTAGIWKVSQPDLEGVAFPLPSIEHQASIVQRVQALMNLASEIERRHDASAKQVLRLTPLTLAKAFRGELVPQDPNDEPASAILTELRATDAQAALETTRRPAKTLGKRPTVRKLGKETVRAAILNFKMDRFSFNDLRAQVSGDYEHLKTALFELLEEPSPVVRQVFDEESKAMQLVRAKP